MSALRTLARHPLPLALTLVLGGFALRLPNADRQLEYDEVITLLFGTHSFGDIVRATAADTMPPLHYWLMRLWDPSGELFSGRFLSTLFSTLTLPAFYVLARRLASRWEALAAMGLLAVSPMAVFYGHYARMYATLALLGTFAAYVFVRWLQGGRARDLAVFTAFAAASLWVHNLAGLLVLALDAAFLLGLRGWPGSLRERVLGLAAAHLAMLAAYAPWLLYLPQQLEKVNRAFWIEPPGPVELARTLVMWHFHLPLPEPVLLPLAFVALAVATVTLLETLRRWRRGTPQERGRVLVAAALAIVPVGIMFGVSQVRPVYVERAVLVSASAYYLLAVGALGRLPLRPVAYGLAAALGVGVAVALVAQASYQEFPRSPFREAAAELRTQVAPGDLVVHDNKLSFFPMHYVAPDLTQAYLPDLPGTANDTLAPGTMDVLGLHPVSLERVAAHPGQVWYVVFERALQQAEAAGRPHQYRTWLDQRLQPASERRVGDLLILQYAGPATRP